jgi:hypothetical protein
LDYNVKGVESKARLIDFHRRFSWLWRLKKGGEDIVYY